VGVPVNDAVPQTDFGSPSRIQPFKHAFDLVLTGFLILFLELACIRWFEARVVFLEFFTNTVLLASFVGVSCGLIAARHERNWLALFPFIAFFTVLAALGFLAIYSHWQGLAIDAGHPVSPQEVFFGAQYQVPDVAQFAVPIDLVVAVFFVLIALMFVGLGQGLGKAFDTHPNRAIGYTLVVGGSLVGIVAFSLLCFLQVEPVVWFFPVVAGIAYLLGQRGQLSSLGILALLGLLLTIAFPYLREKMELRGESVWSPYSVIRYTHWNRTITVNNIGTQQIVPFSEGAAAYSLVHLLEQSAGGPPFKDVLVIGAGSGNEIDHALQHGVERIDAVELDPAIRKIGLDDNPDGPYSDPRVISHIDDGRHFLRLTDRKYDLVVYALADSLMLHSGYSNLGVENYLLTQEAFDDVRRVLNPRGVFVITSYFRQGWVVERVVAMSEKAFGCKPIVLSLPYRQALQSSAQAGLSIILSGCNARISATFSRYANFWMHVAPYRDIGVNGFLIRPGAMPPFERDAWQRIAPTSIRHGAGTLRLATDDWPFLYLRNRLIPSLTLRSMIELGILGFVMVWFFLPKPNGLAPIDLRMSFLGAAFVLLGTRAVVQFGLLFGSTWPVNALVSFAALALLLIASLFALRFPRMGPTWHYVGLLGLLLAALLIPTDTFSVGRDVWRDAIPSALTLGSLFLAGVIFARLFCESPDPDWALGSGFAGAAVGGLSGSFSMLVGFRYLLLLAIAFCLLSLLPKSPVSREAMT
jgi:spermidine synthase